MSRTTRFLKLFLPEDNDYYRVEEDQNENFEKIDKKLEEWDKGKEPTIKIKKSGFNLEKTDSRENDSSKLFTAKGAFDLESELKNEVSKRVNVIHDVKNGSTVVNVNLSKYTHFIVSAINYRGIECPAVIPAIDGSYIVGSSVEDSGNDYFIVRVESSRLSITSVQNFTNKFTKVIGFY